jgi:hypothetical protein
MSYRWKTEANVRSLINVITLLMFSKSMSINQFDRAEKHSLAIRQKYNFAILKDWQHGKAAITYLFVQYVCSIFLHIHKYT